MTTIHLTDAQRDTFAACGLIVIEGEAGYTEREPWPEVGEFPTMVAPEGWRILTEPPKPVVTLTANCPKCDGTGLVRNQVCSEGVMGTITLGEYVVATITPDGDGKFTVSFEAVQP